jgi:hypothetical protein
VTDFHGVEVDEVVCGGHCGDVGSGVRAEAGVARVVELRGRVGLSPR